MKRIWILVALWAAAWGWSVLGAYLTPPAGDGFTRGMNRLGFFLFWQGIAMVLALVLLSLRRRLPSGWPQRLAVLPLALALGMIVLVAFLLIWAQLQGLPTPPPG